MSIWRDRARNTAPDGAAVNRPGGTIARNTLWNFLGIAVTAPIALVAIPPLVKGLGDDLFGLLTIGWTVMGYFSLFDLGVGRATTKYLAEAWHRSDTAHVRQLFWSSIAVHVALGLVGGLLLFGITPWLLRTLRIRPDLIDQAQLTFQLLAVSVPIIVLTAAARGVLEGLQRFDLVNVVKVPASALTYLGPLVVLTFTRELPPMIAAIAAGRVLVLVAYLSMCFMVMPALRAPQAPRLAVVGPLMLTGGWFTATTLVQPVIASLDRFIIGAVISLSALTAYAAPYEVVTKLWILSASLLGVLFPQFSIVAADFEHLQRLYRRAVAVLYFATTPMVALVVAFAPEFFAAWLGPEIAGQAAPVARVLALGVLVNVIAQVPWTTLQATGHADITGKLQLAPLPFYAAFAVVAAQQWGVTGVATVWSTRALLDAVMMFGAVSLRLPRLHRAISHRDVVVAIVSGVGLVAWCWGASDLLAQQLPAKILTVLAGVGVFIYLWRLQARALLASAR